MKSRNLVTILSCSLLVGSLLSACGSSGNGKGSESTGTNSTGNGNASVKQVKLTALVGNVNEIVSSAKALIAAFEKKNPNIKIEIEMLPGGVDGGNLLKTKLATGDAGDIIFYNSGSQMQSLNPEMNLADLTNEPFQANIFDSFKQTVSFKGKAIRRSVSIDGCRRLVLQQEGLRRPRVVCAEDME